MSSGSFIGEFGSKEFIPSGNTKPRNTSKRLLLPPTPPVNKTRGVKNHQRSAADRSAASGPTIDSSIESTPVHLCRDSKQKTRSDSTDSGLASGGGNKRQSMDSGVSHRFRSTESDGSSPEGYSNHTGNRDNAKVGSSATLPPITSRDEGAEKPYCGSDVAFHNKAPANEKYLSTASDRAADREVSSILTAPVEPNVIWQDPVAESNYKTNVSPPTLNDAVPLQDKTSRIKEVPAMERSPLFHRRRDVASLLRQKKRHNERSREGKALSADESSPRNSLVTLTDSEFAVSKDPVPARRNRTLHQDDPSSIEASNASKTAPKPSTRTNAPSSQPSNSAAPSSRPLSETNKGISSSDTHRSSVRYEPVITDFTPPSPTHHGNRRKMHGNRSTSSHSREDSDSDVDEIEDDIGDIDDVTRRDEERPLNSRRRKSSPVAEHRSQQNIRGSSYMTRSNSGNLYVPKSGSSSSSNIEQRHHTGIPRMGTGLVQAAVPSHAPNHLPPSSSLYSQQTSSSAMTSRVSSSLPPDTEQYFPVVTTTLKPTYEVDETGLWSFSRGSDAERGNFGGYNPGIPSASLSPHNPAVTSGGPGNNTTARFMKKRPSFAGRHHFDPGHHIRRDSRQYEGSFKKFRTGCWRKCSWKCAALFFIIFSVILLALVGFFLVQMLNNTVAVVDVPNTTQCYSRGQATATTLVEKDAQTAVLQLRRKTAIAIPPGAFNWMQVYVEEPTHLKFNCSVSPNAQLAVYVRKGLRPTHTKFDFVERIDGSSLPTARAVSSQTSILALSTTSSRRRRSTSAVNRNVNVGFVEYLKAGTWHLAVYNDGDKPEEFEIVASISEGLSQCPGSCNNNGDCVGGVCKCFPGFQGKDCSQVSCSITCRGNGVYAHGKCVCFSGWKGVDCATPSDQCIVPDCGGHGQCGSNGECACEAGYKGESCQELDCIDPSCSGHGVCVQGQCRCDRGWKGTVCSEQDLMCMANCAGHGTFDQVTKKCICEPGWGGADCSTAICRPACDTRHGVCVDGACRCEDGWTGDACDVRQCHPRCEEHGNCVRGVCVCDVGWNGDLCTFAGCQNDCSGHGNCILDKDGGWYCACRSGWKGSSCNVDVEVYCTDGKDNDMDTLIDCQDPDCCSHRSCSHSTQCRGGLDPSHEITRIQGRSPSPSTASFFDRVKFLIHRNGVQINADLSNIKPRRASVVRGEVKTRDGSPLVGVQVSIAGQSVYGSTKSRSDGWFDLLVNGGGSLTIAFQRSSFVSTSVTVFAPWNDYVIVPTTTMMTLREPVESDASGGSENCDISRLPQPAAAVLVSSVRAYTAAECSEKGSVIPEIQAIREAVSLPSTQTSLVYLSSRVAGYQSTLTLSLINGEKPANLLQVLVKISVQGKLFQKKFEPVSELQYTYEWQREDAYGQRVYGSVTAKVMVGYLYESCNEAMWKTMMAKVEGYNPSLEDSIGLWSFDIHHTYHPEKGVVHLGNGGEMKLREQPPMMSTVMGNGLSRHDTCDRCDGPAYRSKLMSPVALATDPAGNVYIGDHNFIRKIDVTGNVSSLFSTRNAPAKYYMAVSPLSDGVLYFSHPTERRIYKLRRMTLPSTRRSRDLSSNYEVVAGTGAACYPLQRDNCGDNGPASSARLSAPKGLAVDKQGRVYFVDGTRIRVIEANGTIRSFTGSLLVSGTRPLQCEGSMSLDQLELNFPTSLVISPMDESLFVLDSDVVIGIDVISRQASLVAGVPTHCARNVAKNPDERDARKVNLVSPTSITVSSLDGALYISETDRKFIHRVRRVNPYSGRISTVAGMDSDCDCAVQDCQCFKGDGDFARSASLHNPTAIAATPDGSVYIADQLNLRIRKVHSSLPALSSDRQYSVSNPDTNQLYVFDVNGRHEQTKNVITGTSLYRFSYDAGGRVNSIVDVSGNILLVEYTSSGKPARIVLPNQNVLNLAVDQGGSLTSISRGTSLPMSSFSYQGNDAGLIRSTVTGRHASSFYVYDVYGRLISATSSTGAMTSLHIQINATKHTVTMETAATSEGEEALQVGVGRRDVVITTEPGYLCDIITTTEGAMTTTYKRWTDNSISVHYLDDSELTLETKPHPVLGLTAPFLAKRTIQLPADPLENKIEWRTRNEMEIGFPTHQVLLGRRMRVNDRNILSLDYSQGMMMEKIYDDHTKFMLRVQYNDRGLPTLWMPKRGIQPVNVTYDRLGHAVTWQRGPHNEVVRYDANGNLQSTQKADGSVWRYTYGNKIAHLSVPGVSSQYTFVYDDNDNLQSISLPSGMVCTIDRMIGIGFVRTTIRGPFDFLTLIQDYNDRGNALSLYYPGEKRKVIYRYDAHGHMTEILHDSTRTQMLRDPQSGELVSVSTKDCTMRFHRNGPLVRRHVVTSTTDGGLLAAFDYTHDVNLRLSSIEVKVNGTRLPVEHFTYNDVSGKLTTFGPYRIIDLSANLYVIGNQAVTLTKQSDNNGQITETEVEAYSTITFNMVVHHDAGGRVSSLDVKFGMYANDTRMDYTYTESGALSSVAVDGAMKWRYAYDVDGKLTKVESEGAWRSLRYHKSGRLTSYGDLRYEFDQDGFLRQRGNEVFEYDSMGQLIKAYRLDNSYEIKYGYDGFGRLATRVDVRRNHVLRYLYADVTKQTLVTHVYNATSGLVTTLRYDVEGHVFVMERSDGVSWSVVCDHAGTPLAVLDIAGSVVKRIKYSPFGQVMHDSAPEIHLHIGFRGGIYDVTTGLVHFSDRAVLSPMTTPGITSAKPLGPRPSTEESSGKLQSGVEYDALTGQFTSSGLASLKSARATAVPFKLYQVNDPINTSPKYNHMTDTNSWLNALGFKLQNVAPDPQIASRQKDKSSAECQLSHHLSTYMNLQTATPSVLVPSRDGMIERPAIPGGTLFAQGLVIVIDRGSVTTQVVDSATNDVKRLSGIISGADVIIGKNTDSASAAMSLTLEGKPTLYLSKPASAFDKDQQTLRLVAGHERDLVSAYDEGTRTGSNNPDIAVSLQNKGIRAESEYAIVDIKYVVEDSSSRDTGFTTIAHERELIMKQAINRAESEAWLREKKKIQVGLRTQWAERERQEILSRGHLTSYVARLSWDPEIYPELADSGRNIKFVRKT